MMTKTQVWEKHLEGTDIPLRRALVEVDHEARVLIHEVLLGELLVAAGWTLVEETARP